MHRVGVEIEFEGSMRDVLQAFTDAGLADGHLASYSGQARHPYWSIKSDSSVRDGGELVSPIIDFDDPVQRQWITTAVNLLRQAGGRPCPSAGIHVHVDGTDLTAKQVAGVVRLFAKFEDVIYRIATSGWQSMRDGGVSYCRPYSDAKYRAFAAARTDTELCNVLYGRDEMYNRHDNARSQHGHRARYAGLNVHSWFYRKTIEFRVFNSSVNAERVQGYVAMCVALVEDARRGNVRSINKRYSLGGMLMGSTKPDAALHRFLQVLRYDSCLSPEDMKRIRSIWKDSRPQAEFGRVA